MTGDDADRVGDVAVELADAGERCRKTGEPGFGVGEDRFGYRVLAGLGMGPQRAVGIVIE